MSFYPCSNCGQRANGKLASVYSNWFEPNGDRAAWRSRYCVGCLTTLMASLKAGQSDESSNLTVCPKCGSDSSQNLDGIFLTIYLPKQPEREYALTTCASCASELRALLLVGATKLGDRSVGAAAPTNSPNSEWSGVPW